MGTKGTPVAQVVTAIVFSLVVFALGLFVWTSFGGTVPLGAQGYRVSVQLGPEASNLFPNAQARAAGVRIGHVTKVETRGGRVDAEIELESRYVPLREGTRVILRSKTLLGEAYLELAPGPRTAPAIPEGGRIAQSGVQAAQGVEGALSVFDAKGRRDFRSFLEGLAEATAGRGADLNAALANAPLATEDLRALVSVLDRQRGAIRGLVRDTGTTLQTLSDRSGDVQEVARAGSAVLRTTAARDRELTATVRSLPGLMGSIRRFSAATTAVSADAAPAVRALRPVAPLLAPGLRAGRLLAPDLDAALRALDRTTTAARAGAPALRQLLRRAQPLLRAVGPAGAELVPVLRTLEDYRKEIVASVANTAAATNAVLPRAGGSMKHYLRVLVHLDNELAFGTTTRSGSHRENGYLAPGGLAGLVKGEPLRATSCRDAGNPDALPPIGSGAPPCLQQQPYSLAGGPAGIVPRVVADRPRP